MIDGDAAGDGKAFFLGGADRFEQFRAGDQARVIACSGQPNESEITHEHHGFGYLRNAGKAEPRGEFTFVHNSFRGEIGVLGEVRNDRVAIARIEQGPTHELRVHHAFMAIAESDGAGLLEKADLRHLLAGEPLGERGAREDAQGRSARTGRKMKSTIAGSSITGSVSGRQIKVVMPPVAAARLAEANVSRCSAPGWPTKA